MSAELDAVDSARRSDLQRAARALLRRPVLQAGGATAEQFLLVRRRAEELREWFGRNTGWRLHVDGMDPSRNQQAGDDPCNAMATIHGHGRLHCGSGPFWIVHVAIPPANASLVPGIPKYGLMIAPAVPAVGVSGKPKCLRCPVRQARGDPCLAGLAAS